MQTLHLRFRDLRAISSGAPPRPMAIPLDADAHRHGRRRRLSRTLSDQPWRLDRPAAGAVAPACSTDAAR